MDSNAPSMLKYIMETPAQVRKNIYNAKVLTEDGRAFYKSPL